MRIIAGSLKGQSLKAVPGDATRPTTDKIKEAVFQVLGPYFEGGMALDLFAGSGSLGIEALSRGIEQVIFVDKQGKAIHTIKENLKKVKQEDKTEVFRTDAKRALKAVAKRELSFQLILLDPPYNTIKFKELLEFIVVNDLLDTDGLIYCEHDPSEDLPEEMESLSILKKEKYSNTIAITIYQLQRKGVIL
ncbi:16S rRNA (guanine(966)-N(2))-methyltransferase RsmD [Oceanobacillus sp. CAU 1775]